MLTTVRIENFKAFMDSGDIPLKPLTFLMGANSSGKSSFIQALLVIKQTLANRDGTRQLVSEGDLTSAGSFQDFVFAHETGRNPRFRVSFDLEPNTRDTIGRASLQLSPYLEIEDLDISEITFDVEFARQPRSHRVYPTSTQITTAPDELNLERTVTTRIGRYRTKVEIPGISILYDADTEFPTRFHEAIPGLSARGLSGWSERRQEFIGPVVDRARNRRLGYGYLDGVVFAWTRALSRRLAATIESQFNNLAYLGPMRVSPNRIYLATGEAPGDVGWKGETTFEALWSRQSGHKRPTDLLRWVNDWLASLEIAARVELVRLARSDYFSLVITDSKTNTPINLVDTGFGASQVLPIIVQGFYGPLNRTLMIEQPEIHLHPHGQATLADAFIDMVKNGRTLIAETHSEHIIGRIQRRIAEGKIKSTDVCILYFDRTDEDTHVSELKLSKFGQFEEGGIPEGFFEERYLETVKLMSAIRERTVEVS